MALSYNGNSTPGVLEQMIDARSTCQELLQLLAAENAGLMKQRVEEVETRLQMKRQLTLRLEVLMKELKTRKAEWQGHKDTRNMALRLAEEIGAFQKLAGKNLEMLKAAHQLRADMVAAIRDTIDAHTPKVQTYGRNGYMATTDGGTRVMSREV